MSVNPTHKGSPRQGIASSNVIANDGSTETAVRFLITFRLSPSFALEASSLCILWMEKNGLVVLSRPPFHLNLYQGCDFSSHAHTGPEAPGVLVNRMALQ